MQTVIRLTRRDSGGHEPHAVVLHWQDEDGPTVEEVARAAIVLITHVGALSDGDTITVRDERSRK